MQSYIKNGMLLPLILSFSLLSSCVTNSQEIGETQELTYFEEKLKQAEQGDVDSMNYVGFAYYYGNEIEQSYEKSFEWAMKAAKSGNAASQYNVGWSYEKGEGVQQSYDEALKWYTLSAEQNFPKALSALGYMHYFGYGTTVDYNMAYHFLLKAAGGLNSDAMLNIGVMYEDGKGVEKDLEKAYMWYKMAADNRSDKYTAYKKLQELYDNNDDYALRQIKNPPFGAKQISDDLIYEVQKYVFSSDITEFLSLYAVKSEVDFDSIEKSEVFEEYVNSFVSYPRWYDSCYRADIDGDGKDEILIYALEGTGGESSLKIVSVNDTGIYDFVGEAYENTQMVWHGMNELIKYKGTYYFAVAYSELADRTVSSLQIYSFENKKLGESVCIFEDQKNMNYIKASQSSRDMDTFVDSVESNISDIMATIGINETTYVGAEQELNETELNDLKLNLSNVPEKLNYAIDINNDGINEYFYRQTWLTSSVNSVNQLNLSLYSVNGNSMVEDSLKSFVKDEFISGVLHQFFIKEYNGENYIIMVHQNEGTKNYNITIYKATGKSSELIAVFLVYYTGNGIEIELDNDFIEASNKG